MVDNRKLQPGELTVNGTKSVSTGKNGSDVDCLKALQRFVKYCESEAIGLNLAFVAYCLSIANDALAEEMPGNRVDLSQRN